MRAGRRAFERDRGGRFGYACWSWHIKRTDRLRILVLTGHSSKKMGEVKFPIAPLGAADQERGPWLCWLPLVACALFFCALISYNFVDIDIWHQMALIRESLAA